MQKIIFIFFIIFSSYNIYAGGVDGGGGKSVVCRSANHTILSAEILDLYEAKTQYGLTIIKSSKSYIEQANLILEQLGHGVSEDNKSNDISKFLKLTAKNIDQSKKIILTGNHLTPIDDSFEAITQSGCQIEQLAHFIDQKNVLIDGEIWNAMDETNKAALIVHETIYLQFRNWAAATNSLHARKVVGFGFAGVKIEKVNDGIPNTHYYCMSTDVNTPTMFWIYGHTFQFNIINGIKMFSKSTAQIETDFDIKNTGIHFHFPITFSSFEKGLEIDLITTSDKTDSSSNKHLLIRTGPSNGQNKLVDVICKLHK